MNATTPTPRRVIPAATPVHALQLAGPAQPTADTDAVVLRLRFDCPACRHPLIADPGPGTVAAVLAAHRPHCAAASPVHLGGVLIDVVPPRDRFRGGVVL